MDDGVEVVESDNHDNPDMKARVQKVYRHFRTATMGGCNGRSNGHDGSFIPNMDV